VLVLPDEDDTDVQVALTSFVNKNSLPDFSPLIPWLLAALMMAMGLSLFAWFVASSQSRGFYVFAIPSGWLGLGLAQALELPYLNRVEVYGDFIGLENYLSEPEGDFGRWLLGLTVLRETYSAVNAFLFDVDAGQFIKVMSALTMFAWATWLLSRHKRSSVPWIVTISPMWILFSLGYSEYYPFVAGLVVAVSWQIVSKQDLFSDRTLYVLVGVMPILYVGALPVSLAVLIYAWSASPNASARFRGSLASLASMVISIEVGGEFTGYIANLAETMNLGGLLLDKSAGSKAEVLSSRSFLANPSYALSLEHAIDIWFWINCGIGAVVVVSALLVSRRSIGGLDKSRFARTSWFNLRQWSVFMLLGLAIFYLIFMLPLLGPTRDIDLYFISMFVILLFAGSRFDQVIATAENPSLERLRFMQLSAFGFAPATMALVVFGVSR
jgi:hypothetical protein